MTNDRLWIELGSSRGRRPLGRHQVGNHVVHRDPWSQDMNVYGEVGHRQTLERCRCLVCSSECVIYGDGSAVMTCPQCGWCNDPDVYDERVDPRLTLRREGSGEAVPSVTLSGSSVAD